MRRGLLYASLFATLALASALTWLLVTESGLHWAFARAARGLSGDLSVDALHGRLIGTVRADRLRYRDASAAFEAGTAEIEWTVSALLTGTVRLARVHMRDVRIELATSADTDDSPFPPVAISLADGRIDNLTVERADASPLRLRVLALAGRVGPRGMRVTRLRVEHEQATFDARGRVAWKRSGSIDGDLTWSLQIPETPPFQATGSLQGDVHRLRVQQRFSAPFVATLALELNDLDSALRWSGNLVMDGVAAKQVNAQWPAVRAHGRIDAHGSRDTVQAQAKLSFAHEGDKAPAATLEAKIDWRKNLADVHARWNDVRWPIRGQWLQSPHGEIDLDGVPDKYALRGTTQIRYGALDTKLTLRGQGSQRTLDLTTLQIALLGNELKGRAQLAWQPALTWDVALNGERARLAVKGAQRATGLQLDWDVDVDNLTRFGSALGGAVASRGRLRGKLPRPEIAAFARGRNLKFGQYRASALDARIDLDASDQRDSRIVVDAARLSSDNLALAQAHVELDGRFTRHRIEVRLDQNGRRLELDAEGGLQRDTWKGQIARGRFMSAQHGEWRVAQPAVLQLQASQAKLGVMCWTQNDARLCTDASWQRTGLLAWNMTATAIPATALLGLRSTLALTGTIKGELHLQARTLDDASGDLTLELSPGAMRYTAPGGAVAVSNYRGGHLHAHARAGRIDTDARLSFDDGSDAALRLTLPLGALAGVKTGEQDVAGRLTAHADNVEILAPLVPDLEALHGVLNVDLALDGTVARPRITGQAILTHGGFSVVDLGISIDDVTLALRSKDGRTLAMTGNARSDGGTLALDGKLTLSEGLDWNAAFELSGERFQVSNTPEIEMWVSPQLEIDIRPHTIKILGEVSVPNALIRPRTLVNATTLSPDTVYIGDDAQKTRAAQWAVISNVRLILGKKVRFDGFGFTGNVTGSVNAHDTPGRPTTAEGELSLNGRYEVYGQRLDVESGKLLFAGSAISDPGLDMRATRVIGDITAGVLARGTLKQPRLTLYSEPPMNEADVLSYLLIGRPVEQATRSEGETLYNASTALSLAGGELLARRLGTLFGIDDVHVETKNGNQQQASLVLGTYLSPRLYVSYGVGLFEAINTFTLRYKLGRNWSLQTEAGATSGADVLYTIER